MAPRPTEGEDVKVKQEELPMPTTKVVQVANISPSATREQLYQMFTFLGKIQDLKMYPLETNPNFQSIKQRYCYIQYEDAASVATAQHLANTVLIDNGLVVVPFNEDRIPDEEEALKLGGPALPGQRQLPPNVINQLQYVGDQNVVVTIDPNLSALGLPTYPTLPANTDAGKIEEIRRTVYVGNIPKSTDPTELMRYFNDYIGEVMYVRMAGSDTLPCRYAYIEFSKQSSVPTALQNNGIEFNGASLKIQHSKVAIIKPKAKTEAMAKLEVEEAMRAKGKTDEQPATSRHILNMSLREEYGGRYRSRSPSSRRRSRSRTRSPVRRDWSPRRRSRTRSPPRRERRRSPSPRRRRSPSPARRRSRRSRSRSTSRDRRRRDERKREDRDRDRDRDRDSSRRRDRDRDRDRDRRSDRDRKSDRTSSSSRRDKDKDRDGKKSSSDKSRDKSSSKKEEKEKSSKSDKEVKSEPSTTEVKSEPQPESDKVKDEQSTSKMIDEAFKSEEDEMALRERLLERVLEKANQKEGENDEEDKNVKEEPMDLESNEAEVSGPALPPALEEDTTGVKKEPSSSSLDVKPSKSSSSGAQKDDSESSAASDTNETSPKSKKKDKSSSGKKRSHRKSNEKSSSKAKRHRRRRTSSTSSGGNAEQTDSD